MVSVVQRELTLLADVITCRRLYAPYLDVPAIDEEIGMVTAVKGQDWFIGMGNLVLTKPVINPEFVGRPDKVAITTRHSLALLPTIEPQCNSIIGTEPFDDRLADSMDVSNRGKTETRSVLAFQGGSIGQDGALASRFCIRESGYTKFLQPERDGSEIDSIKSGYLSIRTMLDVDHPIQLIFGRCSDAPIGQPAPFWPGGNLIAGKPSSHADVLHRVLRRNGSSREALGNVQVL